MVLKILLIIGLFILSIGIIILWNQYYRAEKLKDMNRGYKDEDE